MKRDFILGFLFLIFLILPVISAVQIDMKSNFSQGETLLAQVSGNFQDQIQQQNVFLYQGHVRISFIPYVQKIQDKFYIYGQLSGKSSGNYSLVISGVNYIQSGKSYNNDIVENFTIGNSMADFSINSGFLQSSGNFSIDATSLADNTITINSFIKNSTTQSSGLFGLFGGISQEGAKTQISPGQTKSVYFSASNSYNNQLVYAVLETGNTSYEVPIFISGSGINETIPQNQISLEFQPSHREITIATNSTTFIYLYLNNSGEINLNNISLSVSDNLKPYVFISNSGINLDSNSTVRITANISSGSNANITDGIITATYQNETSEFTLSLNFSKTYVPTANGTSLFQTCAELGGQFCSAGQTCSAPTKNAENGPCCVGTCQTPNNSGKIIGWVLVAIIVLLVIVFFVWRYFKAKRPFNLLDFAKKK
jgi:hypothetical protein